jgi:hypothetical protein
MDTIFHGGFAFIGLGFLNSSTNYCYPPISLAVVKKISGGPVESPDVDVS